VFLAEGPWPGKAYFDAHRRARQRDASLYLDYGHSRPGVFSRGAITQNFETIGADARAVQLPPRDPATREDEQQVPRVFPGTPQDKVAPELIPTPPPAPGVAPIALPPLTTTGRDEAVRAVANWSKAVLPPGREVTTPDAAAATQLR
jgi:hypothetical protein